MDAGEMMELDSLLTEWKLQSTLTLAESRQIRTTILQTETQPLSVIWWKSVTGAAGQALKFSNQLTASSAH